MALSETFRLKSLGNEARVEVVAPDHEGDWILVGDALLPARFDVVVKDARFPVRLAVEVDADGGLHCVSVGRIETPVRIGRKFLPKGPSLKSGHLKLPLDSLLRELAIALARTWDRSAVSGEDAWVPIRTRLEARARLEEKLSQASRPRLGRGARVSDDFLELVATIYRDALAAGRPPTQEVYEVMGAKREFQPLHRSTAGRWVLQARRRGFLPPTEKRKARA